MDIVYIFFIYGLAFFSMGLAMMMEARRSPLLAEARVLRPLALFGFVHGSHEWFEMAILVRGWFGLRTPPLIPWIRLSVLIFSFTSLIIFGLQVLRPQKRRLSAKGILVGIGFLGLYSILAISTSLAYQNNPDKWLEHADILSRYTLAVPGAVLAAIALNSQSRQAQTEDRRKLAASLRLTAWSFAFYSSTQLVVNPSDLFPANFLNTAVFTDLTGVPIQLVRAVLAVLITVGLIRATHVVEDERERQLLIAQEARLEAMEQIQRELVKRESMRRELLRHTVIAQEDERARIARELHDETSQYLTALSLNLAILHESMPDNQDVNRVVNQMQTLSRQMSRGIYRMVHDLRPAQLDDLGLVAALQYLADEEKSRGGLDISLAVIGPQQRLDPLVETVFFRVAQEALTNAARHAYCDRVSVQLHFLPDLVSLQVKDEGVGFDPDEHHSPPRGWGLAGMRERAESIGGQLKVQSTPGDGVWIELVVRLNRTQVNDDPGGSL